MGTTEGAAVRRRRQQGRRGAATCCWSPAWARQGAAELARVARNRGGGAPAGCSHGEGGGRGRWRCSMTARRPDVTADEAGRQRSGTPATRCSGGASSSAGSGHGGQRRRRPASRRCGRRGHGDRARGREREEGEMGIGREAPACVGGGSGRERGGGVKGSRESREPARVRMGFSGLRLQEAQVAGWGSLSSLSLISLAEKN